MSVADTRVLLVTLSNVGDAIMTTPVLEAMHRAWPAARIDIHADPRSAELFSCCPYLGDLIVRSRRATILDRLADLRKLRTQRYEAAVDLRTDFQAWLVRARHRYTKVRATPLGPHAVERHLGVVRDLLDAAPAPTTTLWWHAAHAARAVSLLASLPGTRWLALGPGCKGPEKRWPLAGYRELIATTLTRWDGIVLVGNDADAAITRELAADLPLPVVDLAGRTALLEAAAVLARARAFVGSDSGLGHIAAATGVPTLALFGPTDAIRYHPWGRRTDWLVAPGGALAALPAPVVAAALERLLERAGCG